MKDPSVIGRLNGIQASPGTILGPDDSGRYYAVASCDESGVDVRFATRDDRDALDDPEHAPASVAEHEINLIQHRQGKAI